MHKKLLHLFICLLAWFGVLCRLLWRLTGWKQQMGSLDAKRDVKMVELHDWSFIQSFLWIYIQCILFIKVWTDSNDSFILQQSLYLDLHLKQAAVQNEKQTCNGTCIGPLEGLITPFKGSYRSIFMGGRRPENISKVWNSWKFLRNWTPEQTAFCMRRQKKKKSAIALTSSAK